MKIISIKDGQSYTVTYDNGMVSHVPKANGNMDYERVKEALQGGTEDYPTAIVLEPEFTDAELLEQAKATKLAQILNDYNVADASPVLYNGVMYNGGEASVTSIDKYVRLNRLAGITTHTIWDFNNQDTVLTDTQIDELVLAIGVVASQNKFTLKNRKLALYNAATIAEVEAV